MIDNEKVITPAGFKAMNGGAVALYMHNLRIKHPFYRDRTSDQIWLNPHSNDVHLENILKK